MTTRSEVLAVGRLRRIWRQTQAAAIRLTLVVLATLLAAPAVSAQQSYPQLSRDEELRLAMSAGPLTVTQDADVYVLGEHGFERVIEGSNGFACLVVRSARDRTLLAPHCLNPAATETVLPAMLREGELQAEGLDANEIEARLKQEWDDGELPLPAGPAYAYMLSEGQRLGPAGNFKPHFMLYVPYVTNADIGGDPRHQEFPFVGPYENHPLSTVVIIMDEFVKPENVVLRRR